jgi:phenylacetate-CoA ligase
MAIGRRLQGELARRVLYPAAERLQGRQVRTKIAAIAAHRGLPPAERRAAAQQALAAMVGWAGICVPYYRDLFRRLAFDPALLARDPARLEALPYLTKEIIRAEGPRLLREDHADQLPRHSSRTGGSTGPAAEIWYDQEAADWSSAVTRHARASIGKHHGLSELHLASRFPETFPLRDRLKEQAKCLAMNRSNAFIADFDAPSLQALWRRIKDVRPYLVHGHPSTLYHLARHVEAACGADQAFAVFESSGELLEPLQRTTIARALRCRVVDRYGLAEFGVVAYQVRGDEAALDLYDDQVWPETDAGELVLTGLRNRMMPLIRYRTGDLATLGESGNGPMLSDLVGRIHDVVEIAGRRYPTHYVQDLLQRIGGVAEFQVTAAARPELRLVAEPGADQAAIRDRLAAWWGDAVAVRFIDPAALVLQGHRGKFRHLVPTAP